MKNAAEGVIIAYNGVKLVMPKVFFERTGKHMENKSPEFKTAAELRKMYLSEASSAKERLNMLFDEGTFAETGAYAHKLAAEFGKTDCELEGVICGYGAIDGRLVFAFAQDFSRNKGAFGEMQAKKICNLYDLAIKNASPVIGIFDSAGAYVLEGVEALAGYGKVMKKVSEASGVIPQIALIAGACGGAMATVAAMFDIAVGCADSGKYYVNPPFITNNMEKGADLGSVKTGAMLGNISKVCENCESAIAYIRELMSYTPQNSADGTVYSLSNGAANKLTPELEAMIPSGGYSMKEVLKSVSDDGKFFELSEEYAGTMLTGFVTLNGRVVGAVANEPSVKGGKLTGSAAKKAARFVSYCDSFNIPVLTLVDTEGYAVSPEAEKSQYAQALAKLASAYASSDNAKVTVVLGKAYGAAYTLMGSKSIGADIVFAADCAKISAMPTKSAVAFLSGDISKQKANEAEWDKVMASPVVAAKAGEVDDIISLDELGMRVAAAFEMLSAKNSCNVCKKHGNLPM